MQNTDRLCMGCMNDNGGEQVCSICGYDEASPRNPSFLPARSWLQDRYLVGKLLENNGEGATYLGWDNESNTVVRVREYFPAGLCERRPDSSVKIADGSEYSYNEGLLAFLDLARTLTRLKDSPGLMPVYDIFEAGGTAYYVSETVSGITLREFLLRNGGTLRWEQARSLFLPLIATLKALHNNQVIHRGISPDTLVVGRDGKMRLTGFCIAAARTARSDMTAQLFPGFAAIEQYGFDGQQGPWTDAYGFAATLYRTLVGNPPPEATERVTNDNMTIPARIASLLPSYVLTALANALQILPEDRTQSMDELREDLVQISSDTAPISVRKKEGEAVAASGKKKKKSGAKRYGVLAGAITGGVILAIVLVLCLTVFRKYIFPSDSSGVTGMAPPPLSSGEVISADVGEKQYAIPNVVGQTYAQLTTNPEYLDIFEFEIVSASYNDTQKRGAVYEQSPVADTTVNKGTKIQLRISLGPANIKMINVLGKTYNDAYIALLEQGFLKDNIQVYDKYDATKTPGTVIATEPSNGADISPEGLVKVFVNSYKETSSTPSSSKAPPVTSTTPSSTPSSSRPETSSDHSASSSRPATSVDGASTSR